MFVFGSMDMEASLEFDYHKKDRKNIKTRLEFAKKIFLVLKSIFFYSNDGERIDFVIYKVIFKHANINLNHT
jgi:hypothetical protein